MVFFNDTPANVQTLCQNIPGLPASVAKAWLRCEGQAVSNPTNPLNILYGPYRTQIGAKGRFGVYKSAEDGLKDAAWLINQSVYYQSVRTAIAQAKGMAAADAAVKVARAIEDSPWAGGHYGGGGNKNGCIVKNLGTVTPEPPKPPKPTGKTYTVKAGDSLWKIAEAFYKDGNAWPKIYNANKDVIGPNPSLIRPGQVLKIP